MKYILYNSLANTQKVLEYVDNFKKENDNVIVDALKINYEDFFKSLKTEDVVYLLGGDGTINYLINHIDVENLNNEIYLIPAGTGNDFYSDIVIKDINAKDNNEKLPDKILLNPYLLNLPTVEVNGIEKKFINGVGFGIDGYCCEVGDELKEKGSKKINYTMIAIKGLLFHFKKVNSRVEIDGKVYNFKDVWLTPTMKGRYYGGGMIIAPNQNRNDANAVSTVIYKSKSKLKALITFPSVFKGTHINKTKVVTVLTGKNVKVTFDKPTALQIDGETIKNVLTYSVRG